MSFKDLFAAGAAQIYARLGDDAVLVPASGGDAVACSAILRRPIDKDVLQGAKLARAKPVVRVPLSQISVLHQNDVFQIEGRRWRVEAAPMRPGAGLVWEAEVADVGPVP